MTKYYNPYTLINNLCDVKSILSEDVEYHLFSNISSHMHTRRETEGEDESEHSKQDHLAPSILKHKLSSTVLPINV